MLYCSAALLESTFWDSTIYLSSVYAMGIIYCQHSSLCSLQLKHLNKFVQCYTALQHYTLVNLLRFHYISLIQLMLWVSYIADSVERVTVFPAHVTTTCLILVCLCTYTYKSLCLDVCSIIVFCGFSQNLFCKGRLRDVNMFLEYWIPE